MFSRLAVSQVDWSGWWSALNPPNLVRARPRVESRLVGTHVIGRQIQTRGVQRFTRPE